MASIVSVEQLQGLAAGSTPNTITVPTGQKIAGTDSGSIVAPGMAIQHLVVRDVTELTINTTSLTATNLTLNFTPKFSNSRVVIEGHIGMNVDGQINQGIGANLYIDGSKITNATDYLGLASNSNKFIVFYHDSDQNRDHYQQLPYKVVADGQFTAETSYTVEIRVRGWITTANQRYNPGGYNGSIMTITEIAQ